MNRPRLLPLTDRALSPELGGKIAGLRWLADQGFVIPATWVMPAPPADRDAIAAALRPVVRPGGRYAVRSSANVEDGGAISYAGQFATRLDVVGLDEVTDAVVEVIASSEADGVTSYRSYVSDHRPVVMSVIVQDMVPPAVSGVAFSKNPITGLSEIVVEAVPGCGEPLMTGAATPDRWVRRWGDYVSEPESSKIEPAVIRSVVSGLGEIAAAHGSPVDVEWVHDGVRLWWLQVRPITGLDGVTIYSQRISREVMPGIIKPLVWSVNVPMVNQAWVDLFEEALGSIDVAPEDLAKSFGYRSYFNMTAMGEIFAAMGMPRESLELLLGLPTGSEQPRFRPTPATMTKLPRMLAMAIRKSRYGSEVERSLPELDATYTAYAAKDLGVLSDAALLADVDDLRRLGVRAAGVNIVTPLLANVYTALLRRQLDKAGLDLEELHLTEGMDELEAFDPNPHLDRLAARIRQLDDAQRAAVVEGGYAAVPAELRSEVDAFLERFGHFSDSGNDFSVPAWREMPDTVVRLAASRTPAARTYAPVSWAYAEGSMPRWRRPWLRLVRSRARTFVRHREAVSSLYTFGYGIFRHYFVEIGRRLSRRGLIEEPEDVMFLTLDEVTAAVTGDPGEPRPAALVTQRKAEIERVGDLEMPEVIYGDDFIPQPADDHARSVWRGVATARGHHRGRVCVVRGIADFDKVRPGDVLAIPYSDVGWTPLFADAGAVVAESGGMLSHSSIVAREYGIPCVVSVPRATSMPAGAMVTVDGYRGIVTLQEQGVST